MSRFKLCMLPGVIIIAGILFLLSSHHIRRRTMQELEQMFDDRVHTAAMLASRSIQEAILSTSILYEMAEERLSDAAGLLQRFEDNQEVMEIVIREMEVTVHVVQSSDESMRGIWGPVPSEQRDAFIQWANSSETSVITQDGPARDMSLICLPQEWNTRRAVTCQDATPLRNFMRETGIGPLLQHLVDEKFLFVVLQDQNGIIAAAPSDSILSTWHEDEQLQYVLEEDLYVPRIVSNDETSYFEGLLPFDMPDQTTVLLRLAIDASPLLRMQSNVKRHHETTTLLIVLVMVVVTAGVIVFAKWQSRREQMEKELTRHQAEMRHFEMIGQMAASVAHEIRNPLNTVKMIASRLKTEFVLDRDTDIECQELLNTLEQESDKVNRVVTEFLELGKPGSLHLETVDIAEAIQMAVAPSVLRTESEQKELQIINACDGQMRTDINRFSRIVVNLLDNALDEISPGERVTMQIDCRAASLRMRISGKGPPLTNEEIEEMMKPFVSRKAQGTGLGLTIVNRYVLMMGGQFDLCPGDNGGIIATVQLPREPGEARNGT